MQMTRDLALAFPIGFSSDGTAVIWAYHTPLNTEVFRANYRIIAASRHELWKNGVGYAGTIGPQIASMTLKDVALRDSAEHGIFDRDGKPMDSSVPLLAEIRRTTMVLSPSTVGYNLLPVDIAIRDGVIDAADWEEVESSIVFFTCSSLLMPRKARQGFSEALASAMRGVITSLPPTEFVASLTTSTQEESSTPPQQSSLPS